MGLYNELDKVHHSICHEFEDENYNLDALQKIAFNYTRGMTVPQSLLVQTPLAKFESDICDLMDKSGYSYSLDFITITPTCDGECYEIYYHLCWYNNKIHTKTFFFETVY